MCLLQYNKYDITYQNNYISLHVVPGNFNGLHAGGPNCLLGGASPQVLGADGQGPPPPPTKPSLKATSSKLKIVFVVQFSC